MTPARKRQLFSAILLAAVWVATMLSLATSWHNSLNAATVAICAPVMYAMPVIAACASWQESIRVGANARPVWMHTPRRWSAVHSRQVLQTYLISVFLPQFLLSGAILVVTWVRHTPGYLDYRYLGLSFGLGAIALCIGTVAAHLNLGMIRNAIFAVILGLFSGIYLVRLPGIVNTWETLNPLAWAAISTCLALLIGALCLLYTLPRTIPMTNRSVAGVSLTTLVIITILFGGVQPVGVTRTQAKSPECTTTRHDRACVWPEDAFKLDSLNAQLTRQRSLIETAQMSIPPVIAAEPGLSLPPQNIVLYPFGGDNPSWSGAQSLLAAFPWTTCPPSEDSDLLYVLINNYLYGDIDFRGFATQDPAADANRVRLTEQLKKLDPDDLRARLAASLSTYFTTCTFHAEELVP